MISGDRVVAVDLFCGAGGFSTGLKWACDALGYDLVLAAINHWDPAVETHRTNHPDARQYHSKVEQLHPPNVVGELLAESAAIDDPDQVSVDVDILLAGPECTHFANARGGKPVTEQKRMSPWQVLDWLEKLDVDVFVLENVKEIRDWGPVENGQPSRNGEVFDAWVNALNKLGYAVQWDVLNAADYGDPTSRERFFVVGRQTGQASFPEPTHSEDGAGDTDPWCTAAEIIDWSDPGGSIWTRDLSDPRKRPLKNSTMKRIAEGIRRHCDDRLAPLADALSGIGREDVKRLRENVVAWSDAATVAAAVDHPFLVACPGRSVSGVCLAAPYLLRQQSGGVPAAVDDGPVPTISAAGSIGLVEPRPRPLVMPRNGAYRGLHSNPLYRPEERPLHTVTARNTDGYLVTPYLCPMYNGRDGQRPRVRRVDRPLSTVVASKSPAGLATPVVSPFLDNYQGPPASVEEPIGTVTSRDRFALCVPEEYPWGLDVRYRMLQPRELKRAQGFPSDYDISGNKTETTEQIGNAVPVNLARQLCIHLLSATDPDLSTFGGGASADPEYQVPDYEEVVSDD